jgi:hypothetical protein
VVPQERGGKVAVSRKPKTLTTGARRLLVLVCAIALLPGDTLADMLFPRETQASAPQEQATKIPPDQLDALVAPIALYPDPMLAQTLAASTYPLEIIQLQQWLTKNSGMKDKALADAVAKQPWDPSVQALAGLPDVVKRLANDIQWTTDLGNAFLAQQNDVMEAVQRMRKKAQGTGNLKSNEQQKVETKVIESKSVIVVEQANPQVVYVPSYNPTVVYGPPVYPYPPVTYPPPGYYAAGMAISFGVGVAMGAFWGGGGWGYGCGWGGNNDITVNRNNNFNRNTNISGGNRVSNQSVRGGGAGNGWQHNPTHRGGAPYGNRATADRFGGSARGDSLANRQAGARQQVGRQGGNLPSNRGAGGGGAGLSDRAAGAGGAGVGNRGAGGGGAGGGNRAAGGGGAGLSDRAAGAGGANRPAGAGGGGGDRVGSRDLSGGGGNRSAFGGGSGGGYSGANARASSSRGASSMGSRGGGGGGRRR